MPTNVLVPRLGEGVEEVTVTRWLKKVGDPIEELEALLEVNTDKVDTEIPSPVSGIVLQLLMEEGQVAVVGSMLAVIGEKGIQVKEQSGPMQEQLPTGSQPETQSSAPGQGAATAVERELGFISPVVARIAAEHGLDLQSVKGSGLGGRITKNDVLAIIEDKSKLELAQRPLTGTPAADQTDGASETFAPNQSEGDRIIKHSAIRKSIAEHMLASKRTSPHVLTVMEVDMSRVTAHRAANKEAFARDGANLTYTAYFMNAIVTGLKSHPMANSSWSEAGVVVHAAINIGMAASLGEDGLIVPVIKGADGLSLLGMARAVNDLAERARSRKLKPDEVKGGTFTLTNHGVSGSLFAMPIINQPQCGILGVGALQKRAVVVTDTGGNDAIAIRLMVYLSYVFDHRILDGASADWFLAKVKQTLEKWGS